MSRRRSEDPCDRAPGALVLHPVALVALASLVVNDHVLKSAWPGVLSGKLSDAAGMVLFPLVLHALLELGCRAAGRALTRSASRVALTSLVLLTAGGFTFVELTVLGDAMYRFGIGSLQWPFRALLSLSTGNGVPVLRPVSATPDPTDLLTLPFGLAALAVERGWRASSRRLASAAVTALAMCLFHPSSATAAEGTGPPELAESRRHEGFYAACDLGVGGFFLNSDASVSNGFRQAVPSRAEGHALGGTMSAGGTIPSTSLVVGGRLGYLWTAGTPVYETRGYRFSPTHHTLDYYELAGFVRYYLGPSSGFHLGTGVGSVSLLLRRAVDKSRQPRLPGSEEQPGLSLSPEVGYALWLGRKLRGGVVARVNVARLFGSQGQSTLVIPAALASFSFN
jgi:hypothetical protein